MESSQSDTVENLESLDGEPSLKASKEERLLTALCYPVWFYLFPIVFVVKRWRDNKFVRRHLLEALVGGLFFWGLMVVMGSLGATIGRWTTPLRLLFYMLQTLVIWGGWFWQAKSALLALSGQPADSYFSDFLFRFADRVAGVDEPLGSEETGEEN